MAGDVDQLLFCIVTGTNLYGSSTAHSNLVGPIPVPDTFVGTGDLITASGYWGLRAYSAGTRGQPLIKLRRSSDDAQSDFSSTAAGDLDVAAISAWGGSDTLYITRLYDQIGSAFFHQDTLTEQLILKLAHINGKPAIWCSGAPRNMGTSNLVSGLVWSWAVVAQRANTDAQNLLTGGGDITYFLQAAGTAHQWAMITYIGGPFPNVSLSPLMDGSFHAIQAVYNGASSKIYANGSLEGAGALDLGTANSYNMILGGTAAFGYATDLYFTELVFYGGLALSSTQAIAINNNHHNYWGPL